MPTEKVLIYRSFHTEESSRADLKTLFRHYGLFSQVDVIDFDENTTLDQLKAKTTTVVIPGGYACSMGAELEKKASSLQKLFSEGSNGVFICAGGYLATENLRLCDRSTNPPTIFPLDSGYSLHLNDFTAVGPFSPEANYIQEQKELKKYKYTWLCS